MLALHRALLRLRREDPVMARAGREALTAEAHEPLLVVKRWRDGAERVLVANLGDAARGVAGASARARRIDRARAPCPAAVVGR